MANAANWDAAVVSENPSSTSSGLGVDMQEGFRSRMIDRLVANARAIRGAPEGIILVVIAAAGISGFGFQHYRQRLADLNERLATQDRVLTVHRIKLTEAGTQIQKLTATLADAERASGRRRICPR